MLEQMVLMVSLALASPDVSAGEREYRASELIDLLKGQAEGIQSFQANIEQISTPFWEGVEQLAREVKLKIEWYKKNGRPIPAGLEDRLNPRQHLSK